jgi:signal transduction histidine kinase
MAEEIITGIILITLVFIVITGALIIALVKYYHSRVIMQRQNFQAVLSAQEAERREISQNIHDQLGGLLTAAIMD